MAAGDAFFSENPTKKVLTVKGSGAAASVVTDAAASSSSLKKSAKPAAAAEPVVEEVVEEEATFTAATPVVLTPEVASGAYFSSSLSPEQEELLSIPAEDNPRPAGEECGQAFPQGDRGRGRQRVAAIRSVEDKLAPAVMEDGQNRRVGHGGGSPAMASRLRAWAASSSR